jgi:hypothetical protein
MQSLADVDRMSLTSADYYGRFWPMAAVRSGRQVVRIKE